MAVQSRPIRFFAPPAETSKTPNLGLEKAGVKLTSNGAVIVDDYSKSTVDSIYAIGDCTDRMMLTPVAIAEGMAVANTLFNNKPTKPNYLNVADRDFQYAQLRHGRTDRAEAREQNYAVSISIVRRSSR